MVLDRDDVRALAREQREQLHELARPVGNARPHDEVAAADRQPVTHHGDQQRRVDVAAGEEHAHRPFAADLPRQERGEPGRSRALDDELRPLEQEQDRLRDLLVADVDDVVQELVEDPPRQLALPLDEDSVRDRVAGAAGADADEADGRSQLAERDRDPRG
jgi:hypothetical protein